MSDVTRILESIEDGDPKAAEELLPLVYDELRKLAAVRMAAESPDHTLQATALVHEAFILLTDDRQEYDWDNRGHFFAAAAKAMRRILVDGARHKRSLKQGGDRIRVDLDAGLIVAAEHSDNLAAIDEALEKLVETDELAAKLVELRFFAGFKLQDAARILKISPRTADRVWSYARAWLHQEIVEE